MLGRGLRDRRTAAKRAHVLDERVQLTLVEEHASPPRLLVGGAQRHVARAQIKVDRALAHAFQRRAAPLDVPGVARRALPGDALSRDTVARRAIAGVELRAKLGIAQLALVRRSRDTARRLRVCDR